MALDFGTTIPDPQTDSLIEFGFGVFENVLTTEECDEILAGLTSAKRSRAGARHLMKNPTVAGLAYDQRLLTLIRKVLGKEAVPFRATLFEKTGKSNWLVVWHQDTALPLEQEFSSSAWGPWSTKEAVKYAHAPTWALNQILALRIHLDASNSNNGPLKIIPKSHLMGVLTDEQVYMCSRSVAQKECTVGRGGVVAMYPLVIHSSSKATTDPPRRVLHIEYAKSRDLDIGIRLAIC